MDEVEISIKRKLTGVLEVLENFVTAIGWGGSTVTIPGHSLE